MAGIHLLAIDPQNDFCARQGALSVPGAEADMDRLARFVDHASDRLDAIHLTLDTHQRLDVSHPLWFVDASGQAPDPFTVITAHDVETGRWHTRDPEVMVRTLAYLRALEASGRYPHVIWPEHCLVGSEGHNVWPTLFEAFSRWCAHARRLDVVTKGTNPYTEHFSAIRAEVVDPADPDTAVNRSLVSALEQASTVFVGGQASSHCVAHTVRDLVDAVPDPDFPARLVFLTDTASPVPTFEAAAEAFVRDLTARGMRTMDTQHAMSLL